MKVSLNTIKQFTDVDLSVDELKDRISSQLGAIEEVVDLGDRYKDTVIVKVVSVEKHPNADKLHICRVDDGGVVADVERGDDGLVQIVCGAPNVHADMFAVWLPPRSIVPASYDDETPLVLEARALRGVVSQGMLAAGDELAINSEHDGIIEITHDDIMPESISARVRPLQDGLQAGASFAAVFGLDDTIIDIENKMFTHRPDLFGQLGVAREIAGIQHMPFTSPSWYTDLPQFETATSVPLELFNDAPEVVPRFMAVALDTISITPSPLWLQIELMRLGSKAINNVVDSTNYIMLMTAQPVHAYDYDKLRGGTIGARRARAGESIILLNGKTYKLDESDIVIADGEGPIGLAGIMGGGESEVSQETTRIVLEVGTFDMYALRKTSMRHGVFTDALTRFNKGQSPLQNPYVLHRLINIVTSIAGGTQASDVIDLSSEAVQNEYVGREIGQQFIADRLGVDLGDEVVSDLLGNVEFTVESRQGEVFVRHPYWRTDIEIREDIVEEIGRLYGYDRLPRALPLRSTRPVAQNTSRVLATQVRHALAAAGANEVLTYSFVHERTIKSAGQDPAEAYQLANALSPDLQYYRLSLTPSLLDKIHGNSRAGYDQFALFEIGTSHTKKAGLDEVEHLPPGLRRIALSYAAKHNQGTSAYYDVKAILAFLAQQLGLGQLIYKPLERAAQLTVARPFEPLRSARVIDATSEQVIGVIGEYRASVKRAFKLPEYSAGFELMPEAIELALGHTGETYRPLGKYPSVERDVSYHVDEQTSYDSIVRAVESVDIGADRSVTTTPLSLYQADDSDKKTITLRITLRPDDKTLSGDEASDMIATINTAVVAATGAGIV